MNAKTTLTVSTGLGGEIPEAANYFREKIPQMKMLTQYREQKPVEEAQETYYTLITIKSFSKEVSVIAYLQSL